MKFEMVSAHAFKSMAYFRKHSKIRGIAPIKENMHIPQAFGLKKKYMHGSSVISCKKLRGL